MNARPRKPKSRFDGPVLCLMLASAVALLTPRLSPAKEGCHSARPTRPSGLYIRSSEPTRQGPFIFTETFSPKAYERRDYVKRPGDKKPVLYYEHGRGIAPTMGHHGRLVLINDYFATKGCRVVVADLKTHKNWEIDSRVIEVYKRNAQPDPRLVIIPEAYGFSPSDQRVLIGMDLIYVSVPTADLAGRLSKTYKKWWYVVDSLSGRILHEYHTKEPPACWWIY